jgi:Zn-dependent peptidase ImmA (M78 family)
VEVVQLDPVRVNPAIIVWARARMSLDIQAAASLLNHSAEQLQSWENGLTEPTYIQAVGLARKLQFPFGYLFLSEDPKIVLPLPDLRTVAGAELGEPTPNLLAVIEDAVRKQHWYSEFMSEERQQPLPFISRFKIGDKVETIAADIRDVLSIDEETRAQSPNTSAFLTQLVRNAESAGIIVLRSGTVCGNTHRTLSVDEFRGFALLDKTAPLIFINSRDANVAQIFTFAHEVAHLWIGAEGLSNPNFRKKSADQINTIESVCNQVAAEALVPSVNFVREWNSSLNLDQNIELLRLRYRVSRFVILRKAFDRDFIGTNDFFTKLRQFYDTELEKKLKKPEDETSSGHYYNTLYARNSIRLTAAVTEAYSSGRILVTEACNLLGIKTGVLKTIVAAT